MAGAEAVDDANLTEIWPDNLEILHLFLGFITQFRRNATSGLPTGLDYNGVQAGLKMMRRRISADEFQDLQVLESAYIAECVKVASPNANSDPGGRP